MNFCSDLFLVMWAPICCSGFYTNPVLSFLGLFVVHPDTQQLLGISVLLTSRPKRQQRTTTQYKPMEGDAVFFPPVGNCGGVLTVTCQSVSAQSGCQRRVTAHDSQGVHH